MFERALRGLALVGPALVAAVLAGTAHAGAGSGFGEDSVASGSQFTCTLTNAGRVRCWGMNLSGQLGNGSGALVFTPVSVVGVTGAVALAAGNVHACAVLANGTAMCWGSNSTGQLGRGGPTTNVAQPTPAAVIGLSGVIRITAGGDHTCALRTDRTVYCWGGNASGQLGMPGGTQTSPVQVPGLTDVVAITAGNTHTCALLDGGEIRCWGGNDAGQLGNGSTTPGATPVAVSGIDSATAIDAGGRTTCAVLEDRTARCWGANSSGQVGNGGTVDAPLPSPVSGLVDAVSIRTAPWMSCARRESGLVSCWGSNSQGELGRGNLVPSTVPVPVQSLPAVDAIDLGAAHACTRTPAGALWCWGRNIDAQLGNAVRGHDPIPGSAFPGTVDAVAAGQEHTCVLRPGGTVECAGRNDAGQLGNGTFVPAYSKTPVAVANLGGASALAGSFAHTCALVAGTVRCWGANAFGQLGNGTFGNNANVVTVSGITTAVDVATANTTTCARLDDGSVQCWGANGFGQLGDGSAVTRSNVPVTVSGLDDATSLAGQGSTFCALREGGGIRCWGRNQAGQLGDGTTTNRSTPVDVADLGAATLVAVGEDHTCARRAVGGVMCWGSNASGQFGNASFTSSLAPVPSNVPDVSLLRAGRGHTCGRSGTELRCWGLGIWGQLGTSTQIISLNPLVVAGLPLVDDVAGGSDQTCARVAGGQLMCWGRNLYGNFGRGTKGFEELATVVNGTPFVSYALTYSAGSNGAVSGALAQTVDRDDDGTPVTAVPDTGYRFVIWSDGTTANPRTDTDVQADVAVTASFANDAPTIASAQASPPSPYERTATTIAVDASDREAGTLAFAFDCDGDATYEIGPQPASSASCTFAQPGVRTIGVRVSDGPGLATTRTIDVTVLDSAPVATLAPAASVLEDAPIALGAGATSPSSGENIVTVEADCDFDGATFTADLTAVTAAQLGACPGPGAPGIVVIAVRATDDEPQTGPVATAQVTITGVNDAPSLAVGGVAPHAAGTSGAQSVPAFATFDAGPPDEDATQSVDAYVIDGIADPAGVLVDASLAIADDGTLAYTLTGIGGTATITARVRDSGGTENGGADTSTEASFTIDVAPGADLEIAIDDGRSAVSDGETVVYAIVVANGGPNAVTGAALTNTLPATLTDAQWMCVPDLSNGACPTPASGNGALTASVDLAVGGWLRFDLVAVVDTSGGAPIENRVAIAAPDGVTALDTGDDAASDVDTIAGDGVFVDGFENAAAPLTVPGSEAALRTEPDGL